MLNGDVLRETLKKVRLVGCENNSVQSSLYTTTNDNSVDVVQRISYLSWVAMVKRKPVVRICSYGIYAKGDSDSRQLPRFIQPTTRIRARVDIEFGFVVNIKRAKNRVLSYCIDHPGIRDDQ